MGFKFGIIFSIVVILSIVFASVYLIVKYMEFMNMNNNRSKEKLPIIIEKHYNNSNNYKKKKTRDIIIDVECETIRDNKNFLLGDNKHVT
jgi:hypothetical protein